MKLYLFLALLFISKLSLGHLRGNPTIFHVEYSKGKNYNESLKYEKQYKIGEHIQFVKKLYHEGNILIGGVAKGNKFTSYFIDERSKEILIKKLKKDPAIIAKTIELNIKPYILTMMKKRH